MDGPWIGQLPYYSALPGNPYQPGYGPFLPRPSDDFTAGAFAPFSPILPVPVDQPPPGAQRPQPRRRQYQVGDNLPVGVPGSEGYNLASFATLWSLRQPLLDPPPLPPDPQAGDPGTGLGHRADRDAAKAYRGDKKAMRDFGERQAKVRKWFRRPDPNYFTFGAWLDAMLDQVFVYDALSPLHVPGQGPRHGEGPARVGPGLPVAD